MERIYEVPSLRLPGPAPTFSGGNRASLSKHKILSLKEIKDAERKDKGMARSMSSCKGSHKKPDNLEE